MTVRVVAVDTVTGAVVSPQLEPVSVQTTRKLSGLGDGSVSFHVSQVTGVADRLSLGQSTTLVIESDGEVEFAGLIRDFSWTGEQVTVNLVEVGQLLAQRTLTGVGVVPASIDFTGADIGALLVFILKQALSGGSDGWGLPIVWPTVTAGQVSHRVEWWRFQTVQEIIDEVQATPGAPVFDFRPRWQGQKLVWDCLVTGIGDRTHSVIVGTPEHPVQGGVKLELARDFSARLTEMFVTGNGQEARIVWGSAGAAQVPNPFGGPRMVGRSAWGTVETQARADEIARGLLKARQDSTEKWSLSFTYGEDLARAAIRPGDRVEVQHPGDVFISAGVYQRIVLDVARDASQTVKVTVQEVPTMVDRQASGLASVLRRVATVESQASNRASTTIDEINAAVDRAERATTAAQAAADAAAKKADAAQASANKAQSSANAAQASATTAQTRANDAYSYAGRAESSASSAAGAASTAQRSANIAQSAAASAQEKADKAWVNVVRINNDLRKRYGSGPGGSTYPVLQP